MADRKHLPPHALRTTLLALILASLVGIGLHAKAHASKGAGVMAESTPATIATQEAIRTATAEMKPLTLLGRKRGQSGADSDPLLRNRTDAFQDVLRQREQAVPQPEKQDKGLLYSLGLDDEAAALKQKAHSLLVQLGFKESGKTHVMRRAVTHETRQAIADPEAHVPQSPLVAEARQALSRSAANNGKHHDTNGGDLYEELPQGAATEEPAPAVAEGASEETLAATAEAAPQTAAQPKATAQTPAASSAPLTQTAATTSPDPKPIIDTATQDKPQGSILAEGSYGLRMPVSTRLRNSLAIDLVAEKQARKLLTEEAKQALLPVTGELSAVFESGKDGIAAIGYDRRGGTSYGKYQIASRVGSMKLFLNFLDEKAPELAERLRNAGPANTRSRWGGMPSEWKKIAAEDAERFELLQDQFILATNYQPAADGIKEHANLDVAELSPAIREVLWSTAVQHGPRGASNIFAKAARVAQGKEGQEFDETLIEEIYRVRKNDFSSSSSRVRRAVRSRLNTEMDLALEMLAKGNA